MNEILWDVTLPLIYNEAKWLLKALDDCTYTSCYGNKDKCKHTKKEENNNACSSVL